MNAQEFNKADAKLQRAIADARFIKCSAENYKAACNRIQEAAEEMVAVIDQAASEWRKAHPLSKMETYQVPR